MKKELGEGDDDLDDIPFEMLCKLLKKELDQGDKSTDLVIKDWPEPYTMEQLDEFLEIMGRPSCILVADANEQTVIERYLKRAELDAFNKEDDQEKINQFMDYEEKMERFLKAQRKGGR